MHAQQKNICYITNQIYLRLQLVSIFTNIRQHINGVVRYFAGVVYAETQARRLTVPQGRNRVSSWEWRKIEFINFADDRKYH